MTQEPGIIQTLLPGDHLCCLYSTDEEHQAQIVPFLRAGLVRNEKVICIVDEPEVSTFLACLATQGADLIYYVDSGQLRIMTVAETYMQGGAFDPDRMIDLIRREADEALAEGYSALRITGEMSWVRRGLPGSERLIEYESKLNAFSPGSQCLVMCQYDRRLFEPALLRQLLEVHPRVSSSQASAASLCWPG